jgi:hypothetical protein
LKHCSPLPTRPRVVRLVTDLSCIHSWVIPYLVVSIVPNYLHHHSYPFSYTFIFMTTNVKYDLCCCKNFCTLGLIICSNPATPHASLLASLSNNRCISSSSWCEHSGQFT